MATLIGEECGNIIGSRIAAARKAKGLTQSQLASLLADASERKRPYSICMISQWEMGRKKPTLTAFMALASTLGVSVAYLSGTTSSPDQTVPDNPVVADADSPSSSVGKEIPRIVRTEKIPVSEYVYYDKKPVFVVFPNKDFVDQWGILDAKRQSVITLIGKLSFTSHAMTLYPYEIYSYPAYKKRVAKPIPMAELNNAHQMWVEMNSCDDSIRNLYNGWYIHNQNHTALINISNNLVLSYSGYGIAYRVYKEPYDIC